jgi:hypothetical protein
MRENEAITCEIDLETGKIRIVAPPEHFAPAAKAIEGIMALRTKAVESVPSKSGVIGGTASSEEHSRASKDRVGRTAKSSGGSSGRAGRIGSFEPVAFGLSEDQERELHDFYGSKNPKSQPDKVACAMYKAEQVLGRKGLSYNEIYTALRLSGEKELPKALDVLLARMIDENLVSREQDGFALKFLARDYVEQKLPGSEA